MPTLTANIEITAKASNGRLQEIKNNEKSLTVSVRQALKSGRGRLHQVVVY